MSREIDWQHIFKQAETVQNNLASLRRRRTQESFELTFRDQRVSITSRKLEELFGSDWRERVRAIQNMEEAIARERILKDTYTLRDKPPGWQITDPSRHDPDNFRYIIHSVTKRSNLLESLKGATPVKGRTMTGGFQDFSFEAFMRNRQLSCSMIDECDAYPFAQLRYALILDVPEKGIKAASLNDLGNGHSSKVELREESLYRARWPDATMFMQQRHKGGSFHNELVVDIRQPTTQLRHLFIAKLVIKRSC
jgi:hypothetical protein